MDFDVIRAPAYLCFAAYPQKCPTQHTCFVLREISLHTSQYKEGYPSHISHVFLQKHNSHMKGLKLVVCFLVVVAMLLLSPAVVHSAAPPARKPPQYIEYSKNGLAVGEMMLFSVPSYVWIVECVSVWLRKMYWSM